MTPAGWLRRCSMRLTRWTRCNERKKKNDRLFCAHANADGDESRCACQLGPGATREQILAYENAQGRR